MRPPATSIARRAGAVALAALGLAFAACGNEPEPSTPAACLTDAGEYVDALGAAPESVEVEDVAIGDCLPADQPAGELATVGEAMTAAAGELSREAADGDEGAAVGYGYLLGVAEERAGASSIHVDLARRIGADGSALNNAPLPIREAVSSGYDAGREAAGSD